jgi:predicted nucleotidyltransferase
VTQPLVDLRGLLRGLHEHQIEFVLLGAIGMVFYGYVRNTEDLDIAVNPERQNIDRVADWLVSVNATLKLNPARQFRPREGWGLQRGSNATVLTELGQIDVVQHLPGLPPWAQVLDEAEVYEIEGMRVRVLNRRTFIELKRRRGSHQDLADIEAIEMLGEL